MRQPLVAGNWKMNGTRDSVQTLVNGIKDGIGEVNATEVAVCPPFVHIDMTVQALAGTPVKVGGQNLAIEDPGAYTGETSGVMLKDMGCAFVIVGHSERRAYYGETDDLVAQKYAKALAEGLTPILCVGELLEEREAGATEAVVARQLDAVVSAVGAEGIAKGVIAYEPVWAIGTGKTASPEQAQDVHAFIRARVAETDGEVAAGVRILYGGSVKGANATELFAKPDIDGGLIGGASLEAGEFLTICRAGG